MFRWCIKKSGIINLNLNPKTLKSYSLVNIRMSVDLQSRLAEKSRIKQIKNDIFCY